LTQRTRDFACPLEPLDGDLAAEALDHEMLERGDPERRRVDDDVHPNSIVCPGWGPSKERRLHRLRPMNKQEIRPFKFEAPESELTDLRQRIEATRWPTRETVGDASQGVQLATIQALARYWAKDYEWRRFEAQLDGLPQFVTEIDGLDVHFIHVR
jgi:hypothetical protein